jgi:hypothetical protein
VEVLAPGPHATDVEGDLRLAGVERALPVVGDADADAALDL